MQSPAMIGLSVLLLLAASSQARLLPIQNEVLWSADLIEAPLEVQQDELAGRAAGCSIKIRSTEMKNPQPLLIKPGTSEFFPFSATGFVDVEYDKTIEFHCTSSLDSPLSGKFVTAKCVGGTTFKVGDKQHDISAIKCTSWPAFVAKKSGAKCNGGTTLVNVGFERERERERERDSQSVSQLRLQIIA
ncbi:GH22462 [Drosophila grimshawi]|uniref:GH22462 n=1 Tax=Drosophila grimshawi TaxID=7222 RepID=B4K3X2_DROGR|nr:GH22462 [Drosophila grimshawi]